MISIVVTGRNDDYGENFLGRLQNFITVLIPGMQRYAPNTELIIVEWNPPVNRPRFTDALNWPPETAGLDVRIIEVPEEIHRSLPRANTIPFFEPFAKNVGIRRASRDTILMTNPDIIFSNELIALFGNGTFSREWFYRIDRYDTVLPQGLENAEDILKAAHTGIFQVSHKNGCSRGSGEELGTLQFYSPGEPLDNKGSGHIVTLDQLPDDRYWGLHTNASGDFLLTHRDNWDAVGGYAESLDVNSHLDSCLCFQFKAIGLRQAFIVPPCRILHQDHDRDEAARPRDFDFQPLLEDIRDGDIGPNLSGSEWGFADTKLPETRMGRNDGYTPLNTLSHTSSRHEARAARPAAVPVIVWSEDGSKNLEHLWETSVCGKESFDALFFCGRSLYYRRPEITGDHFATPFFPVPGNGRRRFLVRMRSPDNAEAPLVWGVRIQNKECETLDECTIRQSDVNPGEWLETRPAIYGEDTLIRLGLFPLSDAPDVVQLPSCIEVAIISATP